VPRSYTVATAALALRISGKSLDNILSHHKVPGVGQETQGVSRRLTIESLLSLAVILILTQELGMTLRAAIQVAEQIIGGGGAVTSPSGLALQLDLDIVRDNVISRLEGAVEVAPLPRRGRPPKKTTGRLE
jgi:hypothetical protein